MVSDRHPLSTGALSTCTAIILACAAASCSLPSIETAEGPSQVVFDGVSVIPMDAEQVLTNVTVVVAEGRVRAIGPSAEVTIPAGATRVDGRGRFLIPGLWDMHAHFGGPPEILGMFLAAGVTGVRVMSGSPYHLYYRDRIAEGRTIGPELYVAGPIVEGAPPPEFRDVIDTVGRAMVRDSTDGAEVVREQAAQGYDFIKVYNNVPLAAYRGILAAADEIGVPVSGHVPFAVGLEGALVAPQASIEHLRGYVWNLVPADALQRPGADLRSRMVAWAYGDLSRIDALAEKTRAAGVWNVPTLAVRLVMKPDPFVEAYLASEEAAYISDARRRFYTERRDIVWLSNFSDADFSSTMDGFAVADSLVRALIGVGAAVMAGTDTPPSGFALHRELEELVHAGLTPYQALEAATRNPARFLGRDDGSGMVTVGSPGDLVLLNGNPLEDITNTRRIVGLVRRGQWYDRAVLDRFLAEREGR